MPYKIVEVPTNNPIPPSVSIQTTKEGALERMKRMATLRPTGQKPDTSYQKKYSFTTFCVVWEDENPEFGEYAP